MAVTRWKSFGASVRGKRHARACKPNQDSFSIIRRKWGNAVVVSDGVGSCSMAHFGSCAACRAVVFAANMWLEMNDKTDALVEQIHANWLSFIKPFAPENCAATCLFAIRPIEGQIVLGMLGDGLIGALKTDGSYFELMEDKGDCFSNQTTPLSECTTIQQWKTRLIPQNECNTIILCTDEVADGLLPERRAEFVRQICQRGNNYSFSGASRGIRKMLENWPVPKHSDDKTLVCYYSIQEEL